MDQKEFWQPDQVWYPYEADYQIGEPIQRAVERINQRQYGELVDDLRSRVEYFKPNARYERGIAFAVLDGQESEAYSNTDALILFNPYANGPTHNMLIRSEFVRLCAEGSGVRDEAGKPLPVFMIASPSISSEFHFPSGGEKRISKEGRFEDVALEMLKPVRYRNFGRIALAGFSQGGDLALSAAEAAHDSELDAKSVSVGDPAGVVNRSQLALGWGFLKSASSLKPNVLAGGVEPTIIAQGLSKETKPLENDMANFAKSALARTNRTIWKGLTRNGFMGKLADVLESDHLDKIVLGWGEKSSVTPADVVRQELGRMERFGKTSPALTSIEVVDAQHGWGDNLPLLARLYLEQFKA